VAGVTDQNQSQPRLSPQAGNYSSGEPVTLPAVSAVMPVLNEERHLAESVAAVLGQEYPGGFELVLAIGPSKDRTEAIARELAAADSRVTVVPNPTGQIATAMNAAVRTARHEIITRIDAHSMLPDGYLRTAVQTLMQTGAADVGGWMAAEGVTPFQRAVAWAMTSPFGMGAAANHTGGEPGPADTVYLGVYRRSEIERVGGYDETMLIAEDWELNYRIRAAGGLIWFTPELKVTYRPRDTFRALARQQFRYGRWRHVVARRHPETVSLRYLAAPAVTALNFAGCALGIIGLEAWLGYNVPGLRWAILGWAVPVAYLAGTSAVAAVFARDVPLSVRARIPLVLAAMHTCWGGGYLTSPRRLVGRHRPRA
jgi:succinoglycan biosynthesis protein ExoA